MLGGTGALLLGVSHGTWQWTVPAGLVWVVLAALVARAASVRAAVQGAAARWEPVHAVAVLALGYGFVPLGQLLVEDVDGRLQAAGAWVLSAALGFTVHHARTAVDLFLPAEHALIDPVSVTRGNLVGRQIVAFPLHTVLPAAGVSGLYFLELRQTLAA